MPDRETLHRKKALHQKTLRGIGLLCAVVVSGGGILALAQAPSSFPQAPSGPQEPGQLLSPEQLENLVAPIALYPDQLLSEVLAASTYPLEIVEAQQWLQQRGNLQGMQLMDAARQQNWDPSVQALVAFPDALALLSRDVQWTTALGNAFLAQQADVMNAIQRMRARAQSNGRLQSTPQQVVTMLGQGGQAQDGQSAIEIQPANPQVMYVPSYDPQYVWGPPAYGDYPQLGYPSFGQNSLGQISPGEIFGTVVNLASYFLGFAGLLSGGWGWGLSWLTHSLLLNGLFFSHFGFHGGGYGGGPYSGGYGARSAWVHDPGHRMGVPYSNATVATRFGGTFRPATYGFGSSAGFASRSGFASGGAFAAHGASGSGGWRTMNGAGERGFGGAERSSAGRPQEFAGGRGFSSTFNGAGHGSESVASGWHSPSAGRPFEGSGRSFGGSPSGSAFASNAGASGNRGFTSSGYGSPGYGSSGGYRSSANNGMSSAGWGSSTRSALASPDRSLSRNAFGASASSQHFSQQHFSAPKAPHYSAPRSSGSHFSGGGHGSGGHSSGGHSHGGSHKR
jgi:hypothetical protein